MATHINGVRGSGIPVVSQNQFYDLMLPGDEVYCWGRSLVSTAIEDFSKGPSHCFKVWLPVSNGPWATFEATTSKGVRFGKVSDYMSYNGDMVLCRRPISFKQVEAELALAVTLLDDGYDLIEFATLVGRLFDKRFPVIQPSTQLYCSAALQVIATASKPYLAPEHPWATPEQLFTDPSVVTVCALLSQV